MSYREHELEQAYDRLEDQYWELIDYLKACAPATLEAFKRRADRKEIDTYFDKTKETFVSGHDIDSDNPY
jgi:hypothetical protein